MTLLVGRGAELSRAHLLAERLPTHGGVLVITGEAGIGKTELLDAAARFAVAKGCQTMKVTATELEATLPYAALQQIIHAVPRSLDRMRDRPRDVLERAVGLVEGKAPDAFAVAVALLELLTDVAPGVGLLLVVDDAQWLDEPTARALAFAGRRLDQDPASIMFAVRSGHDSPVLEAGFDVIEIRPLGDEEASEFLASHRPGLNSFERMRVRTSAEGNPLALLELPPANDASSGPLTSHLISAFIARLGGLSPETRLLLLAAALDGMDSVVDLAAVASTLGHDADFFHNALEAFSTTRSIDVRGSGFSFRHPLIRTAVISAASPAARRRAHSALALALAAEPDRAVWHLAAIATAPDEEIASRVEQAARRMERRASAAATIDAWATATRLSGDPAQRARRTIRVAESALRAGQVAMALEWLKRVDRRAVGDLERARWALVRLGADPHTADRGELKDLLSDARRLLDSGEIDIAVSLALTVGENLDAGGADTRSDLSELAERIAARLPDDDIRALIVHAAADRAAHSEALARAMLTLNSDEFSSAAELLTRLPPNVDADAIIARVQRRLLDTYRQHGQLRAIANLQPTHAWVEIALANWPDALRAVEEGARLATEIGYPRWATGNLIGAAFIAAVRGEHASADDMIEESERGALEAGANNVLTGVQLTRGVNYIAQGRYDEAFTALRRSFTPSDPSYHPIQSGWALGDLAEAASHVGRIDEVRPFYSREPHAPTSPWQKMAELYAAPFLADHPEGIDAAFTAALAGVVGGWPTYRVRMLVEYGSWLRRQWRIPEAREKLREARDLADALSMRPWSERARGELRATGADSAPATALAWESLSAQELEVAQLAAQGLSNREIGERLFLSHRTVGSHLYRIFPKLGITNRAQLAAALRSPA